MTTESPNLYYNQLLQVLNLAMNSQGRREGGEVGYVCKFCPFDAECKDDLRAHVLDAHLRGKNVTFDLESKVLQTAEVASDVRIARWAFGIRQTFYSCCYCNFTNSDEGGIRSHFERVHSTMLHGMRRAKYSQLSVAVNLLIEIGASSDRLYACKVCLYENTKPLVKLHVKKAHLMGQNLFLEYVGGKYSKLSDVKAKENVLTWMIGKDNVFYCCQLCSFAHEDKSLVSSHQEHLGLRTSRLDCREQKLDNHPGRGISVNSSSARISTSKAPVSGIINLGKYSGTKVQFWQENFVQATLQAVKDKKMDMKKAAKLLGVSYGSLYLRYRERFGRVKVSSTATSSQAMTSSLAETEAVFIKEEEAVLPNDPTVVDAKQLQLKAEEDQKCSNVAEATSACDLVLPEELVSETITSGFNDEENNNLSAFDEKSRLPISISSAVEKTNVVMANEEAFVEPRHEMEKFDQDTEVTVSGTIDVSEFYLKDESQLVEADCEDPLRI